METVQLCLRNGVTKMFTHLCVLVTQRQAWHPVGTQEFYAKGWKYEQMNEGRVTRPAVLNPNAVP